MITYRIATLPGDGIGPEVMAEGVKALRAVGEVADISFEFVEFPYGSDHYLATGEVLPDRAIEEMGQCDAIYFSAVGDPRVEPGILEQGIILKLRFAFDQWVNLRPVKLYPGVPCPLKDKGPGDVDFYVVRENTEDFYIGLGGSFSGSHHSKAQELKRRSYQGRFDVEIDWEPADEVAYQIGAITRTGSERVIRYAFELAQRKGMSRVTSVDKANVMSDVYNFWREIFNDVAANYPEVETEFSYVDAVTMWFVKNPEWFQVVVAPNMFGDIITDLGAIIQGGLGLAPGGNINPDGVSMFEPIHGSAPKYRGMGVANPIATILAGQLMLEHLGEEEEAALLDQAVSDALAEGRVRTRDLGGSASTAEMGDCIAARVRKLAERA
ncbi:MAG: isocitrate/isopropylmalate dehydrogenase family protein [Chloroflexota bacterium]|nr:isocitrate/isopropylmalate dehydrogenase family protein [Chloroflexota bacterium]